MFSRCLRTALLPIFVCFAGSSVSAKGAAPESTARWQARVERYLESDRTNPPPTHAVVFTGSSSIDFWRTMNQDFPGISTVNRGIGGTLLADLPDFAERLVLPLHPHVVVIYAGENDLAVGRTVASVVAAFNRVRTQIFAAEPGARLIFLALKPSPRRRDLLPAMRDANARIAAACRDDRRCIFVDVFSPMLDAAGEPRAELFAVDKLHMNPEGYRLWAKLVTPALHSDN